MGHILGQHERWLVTGNDDVHVETKNRVEKYQNKN